MVSSSHKTPPDITFIWEINETVVCSTLCAPSIQHSRDITGFPLQGAPPVYKSLLLVFITNTESHIMDSQGDIWLVTHETSIWLLTRASWPSNQPNVSMNSTNLSNIWVASPVTYSVLRVSLEEVLPSPHLRNREKSRVHHLFKLPCGALVFGPHRAGCATFLLTACQM